MRRVVITGLGVISPLGNTVRDYFDTLKAGRHGIGHISRFDTEGFKVNIAAEVKNFDPRACLTKDETSKMDLYCQYAMAAAAQAVEDSGILGFVKPERLGVYVGSGIGGMSTFVAETEKLLNRGPRRVSPFFIPMMISNMAAGNISIKYQAKGPALPVVTACASSGHTIGEACRAIRHGYADAVIAGGAEATITPLAIAGFTNCMALSMKNNPDESSLPFDKRRDGFVMGEGAGILILEEYTNAVNRGATIYAEVLGYGSTGDGYHMTAPHPQAEGAAAAFSLALEEARWEPGMAVYINAHGTGTLLNDGAETLAIKKAFGESEAAKLRISSTKSMTGHMLGAAGAVEAIACALALTQGVIPPTAGYLEADPDCDLDYTPVHSVKQDCHLALSASLGFGGHNAVLALGKP